MHPAIRTQNDTLQDQLSFESGLDCSVFPDLARQEFLEAADINVMLRKHGVVPSRPLSYGEVDFDLDLQTAHLAVSQAASGFSQLPPSVQDKYPDLPSLMAAIAAGEEVDLRPTPFPTPQPEVAAPPQPPAAAASEAR